MILCRTEPLAVPRVLVRGPEVPLLGLVDADHRLAELVRVRRKNVDALLPRRFGRYPAGGLAEIWATRIVVWARARPNLDRPEEPALIHPSPDDITPRLRPPDVKAIAGYRQGLASDAAAVGWA